MKYCKSHNNKAYNNQEFSKIEVCKYSGVYQDVNSGKIRVYCFASKAICPLVKTGGKK